MQSREHFPLLCPTSWIPILASSAQGISRLILPCSPLLHESIRHSLAYVLPCIFHPQPMSVQCPFLIKNWTPSLRLLILPCINLSSVHTAAVRDLHSALQMGFLASAGNQQPCGAKLFSSTYGKDSALGTYICRKSERRNEYGLKVLLFFPNGEEETKMRVWFYFISIEEFSFPFKKRNIDLFELSPNIDLFEPSPKIAPSIILLLLFLKEKHLEKRGILYSQMDFTDLWKQFLASAVKFLVNAKAQVCQKPFNCWLVYQGCLMLI